MKVVAHRDVEGFLAVTRAALEADEAANSLMLGICLRLVHQAPTADVGPCLLTAEDERRLVLAALMTPPRKLIVYGQRRDLPQGTRALVEHLVGEGWRVPGVLGPVEEAAAFAASWAAVTGGEYVLQQHLPVYALREVAIPLSAPGRLRVATEADAALVSRWWGEFQLDIFGETDEEAAASEVRRRVTQGDIYLWEDGRPVSMTVKTRPTRRGISLGTVYTPPASRRRGYATACVGELSRLLLSQGFGFCTLFADLANGTANRVYQRIGYQPVCDYDQYTFGGESDAERAP